MKTTLVPVNDTSAVLLAKGPGRVRFGPAGNLAVGDVSVTWATGLKWGAAGGTAEVGELHLLPVEKVYGITNPTAPSFDCVVLEYGTP